MAGTDDRQESEVPRRVVLEPGDTPQAIIDAVDDVASSSDEQLVEVEVRPISRDQHEANQALAEHLGGER